MDVIALRGVRCFGRHGANPGEREREQPFEIDLQLDIDLSDASRSDELAQTLDYGVLHERVKRVVSQRSYALLERLAGEILKVAFEDARVAGAEVRVGKPALLDGATPSVTLRRKNPRCRR